MARVDARYTCDAEQWAAWALPDEEKGKPAKQLKRMVNQWAELEPCFPELKDIHPNMTVALGMAIEAYRVLHEGALSVAPVPTAQPVASTDDNELDPFNQDF